MAQHDQIIDDNTGKPVREDINAALAAIFSSSAGPTEPAVKVAGQLWFDLSTTTLRIRDKDNAAWKAITMSFDTSAVYYSKSEYDARFALAADTYTKTEADALFAPLTYTKTELDAKFNPILDPVFAPASDPTKKAHLDLSLITAGQDRAIRVPDKAGLVLGGWELIVDEELAGIAARNYLDLAPFSTLMIEAELWPAANAAFSMYFSIDNGANWVTAGSYWGFYMYTGGGGTNPAGGVSTDTSLRLTTGNVQVPGAAVMRTLIDMKLWGFNKPRWTRGHMQSCFQNAAGNANSYIFYSGVGLKQASVHNAIRITAGGTILFNGHVTIHGLRG